MIRNLAASWLLVLATAALPAQRPAGSGGQEPSPGSAARAEPGGAGATVRFESNGWPTGAGALDEPVSRRRAPQERRAPAPSAETAAAPGGAAPAVERATRIASGMDLDSPLHDVFKATRSPGLLKTIGGVQARWRLTVHGPEGEVIGVRDYVHTADLTFERRDRLECDGRVFARDDARVIAGRSGIPTAHLKELATTELALFGLHARMPWCYGDGRSFAILDKRAVERAGERLCRLGIERRPPATSDVFGPQRRPRKRDAYALYYEPTTGTPRELVHTFASSGAERRVLLDDWRDFEGVRLPHRRVYVDDALRPRTTMQLLEVRRVRVSDRDFSLL